MDEAGKRSYDDLLETEEMQDLRAELVELSKKCGLRQTNALEMAVNFKRFVHVRGDEEGDGINLEDFIGFLSNLCEANEDDLTSLFHRFDLDQNSTMD
jgi:Ca2+-binding EF-hand superfamily protein